MDASFFIAGKLKFKGKIAMISIAISFIVMIIAVAVSSGFRHEIRDGLSAVAGDVSLVPPHRNVFNEAASINSDLSYLEEIEKVEGVESIVPSVSRAGILKNDDNINGVLFKGVPRGYSEYQVADSVKLGVVIPRTLAAKAELSVGDRMLSYFVGEKVRARNFTVVSIYDPIVEADGKMVVYADITDLQRVNGWEGDQVSSLEILMDRDHRNEEYIKEATMEIGFICSACSQDSDSDVIATSSVSDFPQLFDWLSLIDFNVFFILLLMVLVAGFNMISGLLIMLFENISTIGLLKSLGMTDRSIAKVFLTSSAELVFKGMLVGNVIAVLLCLIQSKTHILKLNPENYFVSSVPVHLDWGMLITAEAIAFLAIMLLLLLPCLFISKVDPAQTVRVK